MNTFPAFFIVGVPRSGTTLARAIITGHPLLDVPPETGFLPRLLRLTRVWWSGDGVRVEAFTRLAFANGRLRRAGVRADDLRNRLRAIPPRSPTATITAIYELLASGPHVIVGDKTPQYVDHVQLLGDTFPEAKFIHMARHPLDVVASLLRQPWGPDDPVAAAQVWQRSMRKYGAVTLPGSRLLTIRLEDLVAYPEATVERMCSHLEVPADVQMLRFAERAERISDQNFHPIAHAGLFKPLATSRTWKAELSAYDAGRAWSVVASVAERLGYAGPPGPLARPRAGEAATRLAGFEIAGSWRHARTFSRLVRR